MQCRARRDGEHYVLDGAKTWISNGGIADFYCVFARTQPADIRSDGTAAAGGISAFVVDAAAPGLLIADRIDIIAPHPMGTLAFQGCRIPVANRLGAEGEGFKIAARAGRIDRSGTVAAHVRPPLGGSSADSSRARRHGDRIGRGPPAHLSSCVAARRR
jgi:acyl-CoA dehydrogenase